MSRAPGSGHHRQTAVPNCASPERRRRRTTQLPNGASARRRTSDLSARDPAYLKARESLDADFRRSNANFRGYPSSLGSRVLASTRSAAIRENPRNSRTSTSQVFRDNEAPIDMNGGSTCRHFPLTTSHCSTDSYRFAAFEPPRFRLHQSSQR